MAITQSTRRRRTIRATVVPSFLLLTLLAFPASAQDWDWVPAGTPPGETVFNELVVDRVDAGSWYLATAGGLYVTRDHGSGWDRAFTGFSHDVVQSPTNARRLFAAAEDSLYRSEDRGDTWMVVHVFPGWIQNIHVSEADSTVYVGLRWYADIPSPAPGIYRSTHRGDAWIHDPFDSGDEHLIIWDIAEDTADGVLYVGAELAPHSDPWNEPLLRSFDGGLTWERIAPPLNYQILKFAVHPGTHDLYYTPESFALFRSGDHGDTYTQLGHRFLLDFLIDPVNPDRFYGGESTFGTWLGGVWVSNDTGVTFEPVGLQGVTIGGVALNRTSSRVHAFGEGNIWIATPPYLRVMHVWPDGHGLYGAIEDAVLDANPGDEIVLHPGIYTGEGNRDIVLDLPLTIRSSSADPDSTVIDCQEAGRAFHVIGADAQTRISGLTIRNGLVDAGGAGSQGGAMYLEDGAAGPLVTYCVFADNRATGHGGAVHGGSQGAPVFLSCRFESNHSDSWGGAFIGGYGTDSCSPTFAGCSFEGNSAPAGGGGAVYAAMNGLGTTRLVGCVFTVNEAMMGGAVAVSGGAFSVTGCTFAGDTAPTGSEIYLNLVDPLIENSIVAFGSGGRGVHCQNGAVPRLTGCDVYGNEGGNWVGCLAGQEGLDDNFSLDPGFCDLAGGDLMLHSTLSPCLPANNGAGLQVGAFGAGCGPVSAVGPRGAVPATPVSLEIYPNPFNARVTIRYQAFAGATGRIAIYDLAGRRVRTLEHGEERDGWRTATWDGRDGSGRDLPSGAYLVRASTGGRAATSKAVLVR